MTGHRSFLEHDWFGGGIPGNVAIGPDVYIDSSYCFAAFASLREPGCVLGEASGVYDRTALVVGRAGLVEVGAYSCLNATTVVCHDRVTIGEHCLLAWGVVLTDTLLDPRTPAGVRRAALEAAADDADRVLPPVAAPRPVTLEDNVWVGFDAVVGPGVTLGRGCLIGCKTVIHEDVPPYAVVVGDPPRIVRTLAPDDTDEARQGAFREYLRG